MGVISKPFLQCTCTCACQYVRYSVQGIYLNLHIFTCTCITDVNVRTEMGCTILGRERDVEGREGVWGLLMMEQILLPAVPIRYTPSTSLLPSKRRINSLKKLILALPSWIVSLQLHRAIISYIHTYVHVHMYIHTAPSHTCTLYMYLPHPFLLT